MHIPDNYDAYDADEAEQERWDRVYKRQEIEEEIEPEELPFFIKFYKEESH